MSEKDIKSEIIQEFLFNYIQILGKEYKDYLKFSSNMCNDEEMYIFIDSVLDESNFYKYDIYLLYLDDFKEVCEKCIDKIAKELPMTHLSFTENWYGECKSNNGKHYKTCELHFWINKGD